MFIRIYTSHIRPIMNYCCIIYDAAATSETKKRNAVQNQSLRICIGADRTSPAVSIQAEANIMALKYRRILLTLQYYINLSKKKNHQNYYKSYHSPLQHKYSRPKPPGARCKTHTRDLGINI